MENSSSIPTYDLAIVGNGIAAQTFLWNLSNKMRLEESKSQNFSIAHIYSEKLAPPCSMRSSATVSLNGIDEDVSPLGNDMREAFFLFDNFYKQYSPEGVEEVTRTVISTNDNNTKKLVRRYKKIDQVSSPRINSIYPGVEYNSYVISPEVFSLWMKKQITIEKSDYQMFVIDMEKKDGTYHLILQDKTIIKAKKVLLATGAFSKIFEKFYLFKNIESRELKNTIKAGSYLERTIDLGEKSFYLSIDGHQVLYRKNKAESKMIIGSATTIGPYEAPDLIGLAKVFGHVKELLTFPIGDIQDFKIVTGLRHKAPKRMMIAHAMDESNSLFQLNGLYKNGYTMGFLASKRMLDLIEPI